MSHLIDFNEREQSFVISMKDRNAATFAWPHAVVAGYKSVHGDDLQLHQSSRVSNIKLHAVIQDLLASGHVGACAYEILIADKEAQHGFDFVGGYAFFNEYKYVMSKMRNVISDVNPSSYVCSLSTRVNGFRFELLTVML